MKKRIFTISTLLVFFVFSGFGCKGLTAEQQAATKPVTLNYWTVFNDTALLKEFADEYKTIRPYVTIKIRQLRQEEFESVLVNALADDVGPDIVSVHVRDLYKYRKRLSAMPSSVGVAKITIKGKYRRETIVETETIPMPSISAVKSNFVATVYDDAVINNQIFGLPLAFDTMALYYNKDLLDQANIPEYPKTWDEFMEAVKASTHFDEKGKIIQSGAALGTGNNISRSFDILSLFMLQSGVKIANVTNITFASGLTNADTKHPVISALRFYTDFARSTKEVYTWDEDRGDALQEFTQGKVVFYLGFAYDYSRIKARAPQMDLAIVPIPQLNAQTPVNVANYWVESVIEKSQNKDEAWDFIRFITTPEKIKKYTEITQRPTPLRSQIKEQQENALMAPFVMYALNAQNWYHGQDTIAAEQAFNDLIHNYLQPYGSATQQAKRDADLVKYTAAVVQQTM